MLISPLLVKGGEEGDLLWRYFIIKFYLTLYRKRFRAYSSLAKRGKRKKILTKDEKNLKFKICNMYSVICLLVFGNYLYFWIFD